MKRSNEKSEKDPFISIIIPAYNCPDGLKETLDSLVNQTYPKEDYEILTVDNNSTDETPKVIEKYEKKYPDLVKGLSEKEIQSSYAARNKGINNAEGDVLAFIDADMWVEEDWLSTIAKEFNDGKPKYLGYDVEIVIEENNLVAQFNKFNGFPIKKYVEERHFAATACLAVSKKIFDEVGLFNHDIISGGDKEFGNRVYENGFELDYTDETKAFHPARDSFYSLMKKNFRIGRGYHQLAKRYPERYQEYERSVFNPRHLMPDPPDILKRSIYPKIGIKMFSFAMLKWLDKIATHLGYAYEEGRHSTD